MVWLMLMLISTDCFPFQTREVNRRKDLTEKYLLRGLSKPTS